MQIIKKHQTLLDMATQYAGTAEALFDLAMLNMLGITDEPAAATELLIVEYELQVIASFKKNNLTIACSKAVDFENGIDGSSFIQVGINENAPIVLQKHQTLLDYSTQHGGMAESLFAMAMLNGIGMTDSIAPGVPLRINVDKKKVVDAFVQKRLDIACLVAIIPPSPGGIGYMQIENDFKVS
jgi:hypothetical protein